MSIDLSLQEIGSSIAWPVLNPSIQQIRCTAKAKTAKVDLSQGLGHFGIEYLGALCGVAEQGFCLRPVISTCEE